MKVFKFLGLAVLALAFNSCSDDDSTPSNEQTNPTYAMTAKINGTQVNMNAPFGSNAASSNWIFGYPDADFITLQGWPVNEGFGGREITIHIKRTDLALGTYTFTGVANADQEMTYADLIDNTNDEDESTVSGSITITAINTTAKTVQGTFQFTTSDDMWDATPVINYTVTDGTFSYRYDVE